MTVRLPALTARLAGVLAIVVVLSACGDESDVTAGPTPTSTTTPTSVETTSPPTTGTTAPPFPATSRVLPDEDGASHTTFLSPPDTEQEDSLCDDPTFTCELPDGSVFDDRWVAIVTLECGSTPSMRRIAGFDAETAGSGEAVLYTGRRQSGGVAFTATPSVGDEVAVDGLIMFWQIQGVFLGPWPPDEINDTCDDPGAHPITEATEAPRPETTESSP